MMIAILNLVLLMALIGVLARPLGRFMARVYSGEVPSLLGVIERWLWKWTGVDPAEEMTWVRYAASILGVNLLGMLLLYALQRFQSVLSLNATRMPSVSPEVAFNTAVSFATNTNWQAYAGETTMSHLVQMLGLTTQNFLSAATGMAVAVALVRGWQRKNCETIGNAWVDLVRSFIHILLPLALVVAVALVSRGVVQTFEATTTVELLDPRGDTPGQQLLYVGPVASQVAIKQIGTNGGGFYNVNSAHPFENPDAASNLLEVWSILVLAVAFCFTFGALVKDARQGRALIAANLILLLPAMILTLASEQKGTPILAAIGVDQAVTAEAPGGNMEGKEVRFGPASSAIWAVATTATSNGSVNAMHDSFTPLGGLVPLVFMQLGEIVFGGVGSGLYGLLAYVLVTVFISGLLVGRTPEYLGKKIEAFEMKMATLIILIPSICVLLGSALAVSTEAGTSVLGNPGPHGFSEILYALSSTSNNNGSAFAGITVSGTFYATLTGVAMLMGRYWVIVPALAIAGSLARKKAIPPSPGTLPTHTPMFVLLLVGVIVLVGALTFVPALALGPVVEHLMMAGST